MSADRWIVIPRWDDFQHYKDRDPVWIKNHRALLHNDAYIGLTLHQRGVLHGLWLEYAASNREIRDSTSTVTRRLGERVTRATLDALNHAGFLEYSASRPLASCYSREETEREEETDKEQEQTIHPSVLSYEPPENGWMEGSKNGQPLDLEHLDLLKDIP